MVIWCKPFIEAKKSLEKYKDDWDKAGITSADIPTAAVMYCGV